MEGGRPFGPTIFPGGDCANTFGPFCGCLGCDGPGGASPSAGFVTGPWFGSPVVKPLGGACAKLLAPLSGYFVCDDPGDVDPSAGFAGPGFFGAVMRPLGVCATVLVVPGFGECCDPRGVDPSAGVRNEPVLFGPVVRPFAGTTPAPVNTAAWLVAAMAGFPWLNEALSCWF